MNLSYKIMLKRGITLDSRTKSNNFHFGPRIMATILDLTLATILDFTLSWPWHFTFTSNVFFKMNFVASELKDPIWHSLEWQIWSFSSEATICLTKLCGKELCITLDLGLKFILTIHVRYIVCRLMAAILDLTLPWPWNLTLISQLILKLNLSYKIMWKRGITLDSRTKSENVHFGHVG